MPRRSSRSRHYHAQGPTYNPDLRFLNKEQKKDIANALKEKRKQAKQKKAVRDAETAVYQEGADRRLYRLAKQREAHYVKFKKHVKSALATKPYASEIKAYAQASRACPLYNVRAVKECSEQASERLLPSMQACRDSLRRRRHEYLEDPPLGKCNHDGTDEVCSPEAYARAMAYCSPSALEYGEAFDQCTHWCERRAQRELRDRLEPAIEAGRKKYNQASDDFGVYPKVNPGYQLRCVDQVDAARWGSDTLCNTHWPCEGSNCQEESKAYCTEAIENRDAAACDLEKAEYWNKLMTVREYEM